MTPTSVPMFFGDEARPLFGWLHPVGVPSGRGIVICNPFGYEAICAHRSLRSLAERAAASGVAALRFDYDGTGDSAGDDLDPGRLEAWLASVDRAIDALRARAGVDRVTLVGVRLGATLAALAAARRSDVEGVAMIAPITRGRAYVRELKLLQAALALAAPPSDAEPEGDVAEALGFALTAETRAALSGIDLAKLDRSPGGRVLILDRDDQPPSEALAARLVELGTEVARRDVAGYVEMVLDPHKAVVPTAILGRAVEWVRQAAGGAVRTSVEPSPELGPALVAPGVTETRVRVGSGRGAFAVLSAPARADAPRPERRLGVLLLNAGAVHHIGPNRMYVALARRWAARGHLVMRLDVSGLGDSPARDGAPDGDVYTEHARADATEALALLRERGAETTVIGGLCSGAYNAFKAAVDGLSVDAILAINPATFSWKKGMSLDVTRTPYTENVVAQEGARYRGSALSPEKWRKLLRGEVRLGPLAQILGRHLASHGRDRLVEVARRVGVRVPGDVGGELEAAARRGVALHFVFATGDPGQAILESRGGSSLSKLERAGRLARTTIDGPDHTFTARWAQARLAVVLDRELARLGRRA